MIKLQCIVFLTKVTTLTKQKVNNIKIIHYYSDGAPSQYKNYKGLVNLCHHRLDHGIDAVWIFLLPVMEKVHLMV